MLAGKIIKWSSSMKSKFFVFFYILLVSFSAAAREYHVSVKGNDKNSGSANSPFRTISKAASVAIRGDIITVHEGTYREMVVPPRGGSSDNYRIVYRAARGEKVGIKGSEIINT